jgi:hypothetical protein
MYSNTPRSRFGSDTDDLTGVEARGKVVALVADADVAGSEGASVVVDGVVGDVVAIDEVDGIDVIVAIEL